MRLAFPWRNQKFLGLALVVLIISSLVLCFDLTHFEQQHRLISHRHKVLERTVVLLLHVKDSENQQIGYLLSGDKGYLQSYQRLSQIVDSQIHQLQQLTRNDAQQQRRINTLKPLLVAKVAELDKLVKLRQDKGFETALAFVQTKSQQQLTGEIRRLTQEILTEENQLLQQHVKVTEAVDRTMTLCRVLSFLLIALTSFLLYRYQIQRQRVEQAQKHVAELELRVGERTADLSQANTLLQQELIERQRVEAALRDSEERLRLVLEGAHMGTWEWNILTNKITWSENLESLFGLTPGTFDGTYETFQKYIHPEDREFVTQAVMTAIETRADYDIEFRVVWPNGNVRWAGSKGKVFYDETGKAVRMLGIDMDISERQAALRERKQAEEEMLKTHDFLQAIIDHLPVALFVKDGKPDNFGAFKLWNKTSEKMFGLTTQEAIGKIGYNFFPKQQAEFFYQKDREAFETGITQDIPEEPIDSLSLGRRLLHTIKVPLYGENHEPEYLLCISEDITERKQAEEKLKTSQAKLNAVLENANAGICFVRVFPDQKCQYEYCSPGVEKIIGYTAAELVANTRLWWSRILPEDRETVLQSAFEQIFAEHPITIEYKFYHKDGSLRWNSESVISRRDEAGDSWLVTRVAIDITDRKQAELALVEREAMLRAIGDNVPNGVIYQIARELDGSDRFYYISAGIEHISGVKPEAVLENSHLLFDQIVKEDCLRLLKAAEESMRNLSIFDIQIRKNTPWGQRWSHLRSAPRRLEDGRTIWDGVEVDITELKRTEDELRQQKEILQTIFNRIPVMLAFFDREGQLQFVNREMENVLGWSEAELKQKDRFILCYPEPENRQQMLEHMQAATGKWRDLKVCTADERILDTSWANVRLSDGSKIGIGQDISDRKRVEEELRKLSADLVRSAFDNAVNGMALISPDGQWLKVNPALCQMLDYSEQELLRLTFQDITHPDDLQGNLNLLQQLQAGEISWIQIEKRYLHKLGHYIWVICSASLVRDNQGQPLYFVVQIQDITQRRAVEQMKNEFVSVVSHELRTPLAAIRGSLGLLAAGVLNNEQEVAKQILDIAASESERLVRLVNDILDLERLEAKKVTWKKQWCDAETLMQKAIETLKLIAEKNNITLSVLLCGVQIWADPDGIMQTLVNLLSNAIKFSPPGSIVTLSAHDQADRILFQIQDQGRGIPDDQLETIFGRFQQVDASDSRQKGGTGLGLAICRKIVQQHGGSIWVESVLGKGSIFYFTLPLPLE